MKKAKKHTFTHKDPEKEPTKEEKTAGVIKEDLSTVYGDLKTSIKTIILFIAILGAMYFLHQKYSLGETFYKLLKL